MAQITNIPEKYVKGFTSLLKLRSESFKNFYSGLSRAPIQNGVRSLATHISKSANIDKETIEGILYSVSSLFSVKERVGSKDIIEDLVAIFSDLEGKKPSKVSINNFRSRLGKLLENEQLHLVSKVYELYSEHDNLFFSSKILTDIRPVFTDVSSEPKATILTNVLHIHFGKSDGNHDDIYIAIDDNDIQSLKNTIERAEQKNKTLRKLIKKDKIKLLDPTKEI